MEVNARKDNNQSMEKISLLYDIIKKDVNSFKLKHSNAGYLFDIKFNEKDKKVKVFLTLLKKSETNPHNEDRATRRWKIYWIIPNHSFPDRCIFLPKQRQSPEGDE